MQGGAGGLASPDLAGGVPRAVLTITVYGVAKTKGSMRHVGNGRMVEQVGGSKPWRDNVRKAALEALQLGPADEQGMAQRAGYPFGANPVAVHIVYTVARPAGHYRTGRNAHLLRDNAPIAPATRTSGDIDKVARNFLDALQDAAVLRDDAQVADLHIVKAFIGEHPQGLVFPGAVIRIRPLGGAA